MNGCTSVASVTITQSTVLTAGSTATDILWHGGNATVTVTANGGTAPFIGTGTFNVTAGTHTYNITDANGCTASTAITVSEPDALTAASSATAIACHGGNATVTVSASGGTAPYTGTGIFNEAAGTYTYNVTDANGCTTSTSITVTEQDALQATSSATAIACHGGNATVTVSASGGTGPYTGSGIFNVTAGTYTYNVTDANGCTTSTTITVTEPDAIQASASATAISCHGGNAVVTVTASGGTAPYTGIGTFNVAAGTYTYTITDANGCSASASVTVSDPPVLNATVTAITQVSCAGSFTGSVTITATGGTPGYTYQLDNGPVISSNQFMGLAAGSYNVTVKDALNCTKTVSFIITESSNTDLTLGADFSSNLFLANGDEVTVIYNVSEASGKAANPVTLRIFKPAGYNILLNNSQTVASTGFQSYTLDNSQWTLSATNNLYVEFSRTQSGNTLDCNQRMNIAFVIQRATPNRSSFILNVQCRKANGEIILTNNTNSIVMVAE
ncbi:MAG: SprB repeat-containing protein [Chitinophagaceae bacterium]|nr:SprB repeat-containing protein [Chitinophagaceae bacterium]